jgi:DNA gyrase subunit A
MASNIPPQNVREVLQTCKAILQRERIKENSNDDVGNKSSDSELIQLVTGPDFPTNANILQTATLRRLYTTDYGGAVMRAVTHVESVVVGGGTKRQQPRTAIIVTELPLSS